MPKKKCAFGFNCGAMLASPGLLAEDCPNNQVCGLIADLSSEEQVALYQLRHGESDIIREELKLTKQNAARLLLMMRGYPQSPSSFGIPETLKTIMSQLENLNNHLAAFEDQYIPPQGSEVHTYKVKRPWGVYQYNKLSADQAVFKSSEREGKVKAIHLSHDNDPRNLEAREGIARRNRLQKLATRLEQISASLVVVLAEYDI